MSNKKRNRRKSVRSCNNKGKSLYMKKLLWGRKTNKKKFSLKRWGIDRFKNATNSFVEDIIKEMIRMMILYILFQFL